MTDPTDPENDAADAGDADEPTPTDDAVRALLADAAGPLPTPPEVAARLDATVADLVAERAAGAAVATTDPEGVILGFDAAARARRRRGRLVLAAAAACVVGAVGFGVLGDRPGADMSAASQLAEDAPARVDGADTAGDAGASGAGVPGAAAGSSAEDSTAELGQSMPADGAARQVGPPSAPEERQDVAGAMRIVRPGQLRADLQALQRAVLADGTDIDYSGRVLLAPADAVCPTAPWGQGHLVAVAYDGGVAVVALRAPIGSTQEVDVLACGSGDVLHSTTLATVG